MIRNIYGVIVEGANMITIQGSHGVFYKGGASAFRLLQNNSGGVERWLEVTYFNTSRYVPTGTENSPRTLSVRYWRRVS